MKFPQFDENFRQAFRDTIPIFTGYLALGMGFGIILSTKGYSFIWAFVMAICIFAGSMQYIAIGLLTSGASLVSVAVTTFLVNARHIFYGISMLEKYKSAGKKAPYLIFALTDETYSLVCRQSLNSHPYKYQYYFTVSLLNHIYWILGCSVGSLVGSVIEFDVAGIDFTLTALFVTIFVEQWLSTDNHIPALVGLCSSLFCLLLFGQEIFLIPSMLMITLVLTYIGKRKKKLNL